MNTQSEAIKSHVIDELNALTVWELASNADTALARVNNAEGTISDGANYLDTVRVTVAEYVRDFEGELDELGAYIQDDSSSIADYALPVYTVDVFQTMLDLFAYREDVSEYSEGRSMEDIAKFAIWTIGERVAGNLGKYVAELIENYEAN